VGCNDSRSFAETLPPVLASFASSSWSFQASPTELLQLHGILLAIHPVSNPPVSDHLLSSIVSMPPQAWTFSSHVDFSSLGPAKCDFLRVADG
jgi:hypothetical protein